MKATTTATARFKRLVVLRNPNSTRAADELRLVPTLKALFEDDQVTDMSLRDWLSRAQAKHLLGKDTLLAVIAGDGTLNSVVSDLLSAPGLSADERRSVVLPLWGGNANDLARMLNGLPSRPRLRQIVRQGAVVEVWPIDFQITPSHGNTRQRLALCYASFGASAKVAQVINDSTFRKITRKTWPALRFARELMLVISTLGHAPRFAVHDYAVDEPRSRHKRRIYERVFLNGPRLAKVERIALKLTDKYFYQTDVTRMRLGALFSRALELSDRRFAGRVAQTHLKFVVPNGVMAQFDGEHVKLKPGTEVEARVHEQPFYALSLRLK